MAEHEDGTNQVRNQIRENPAQSRTTVLAPVFARHETFHPRFGWLKKGFDSASANSKAFSATTAAVQLGVGKNMVTAIRYWCHAFKILRSAQDADGVVGGSEPTPFGRALLMDTGWDPYLENVASLWLLHWSLLQPRCEATSWHFTFSHYPSLEFSSQELVANLETHVARNYPNSRVVAASLRKDANCLLRMYAGHESLAGKISEDSLNCPFANLGLIRRLDGSRYAFNVGYKPTLPAFVLAACCLDFASASDSNVRSISLRRLLNDPGSPGVVFKLSEAALYAAVEEVATKEKNLRLSDTAGVMQLSYKSDPSTLALRLLSNHYDSTGVPA